MRSLTWSAIVLPILFLAVVDVLRHLAFPQLLHTVPGFLATYAVVGIATAIFSHSVFGLVARLQRKITEQNRQLAALNSLALSAGEKLRLQELLETGLDHVIESMKVDAGLICLVDAEQAEHSVTCYRGFSAAVARKIQRAKLRDDPIASEVVRTGRPVVMERVFEDPRVAEAARREGIRSAISAPLKCEGEVNGILAIATQRERHFSHADQHFLSVISSQLGMAIRNAALFEQSQIRNRELSALLAVGKAVTSSFDLDDVLRRALDTAIEVISADAAEIWLAEGDDIVTRCHRGAYREAFLERTRFRLGEGLPGLVAQGPEPVIVHDLPSDPRFLRQEVVRAGFHTFGALPLRYQGRLVGVLAVAALREDVLTKSWELRLLGGIGEWAALAIENARLHQQVQDVAVLKERERIAREMHDGMGQVLGYVIAQALTLKKLFADGKHDDARKELASIEEVARQLYADVREAILGLRTSPHQNGGAVAALREYIERYGEASNIDAALEVAPDAEHTRLHAAAEIQLVRIVQEALTNVRKHARADSLRVGISRDGHDLNVTVVDDGQGFDPSHLRSAGWPRFGLQTMRERAESVGGTFAVETAPGRGTRILVRIPFDESERIGGDDGIVAWSQT